MRRLTLATLISLSFVFLAVACGGDDDGGGDGEASRTPFLAPATLSPDDAIAELDAIISLVNNPDQALVDASGIGEFELMTRAAAVLEGAQVPGLNEVRDLLEEPNRILAAEYLHNNVIEVLALPFTDADTEVISADAMGAIDPLEAFAVRGEDFEVSAVFRDAVVRSIQLWYQI